MDNRNYDNDLSHRVTKLEVKVDELIKDNREADKDRKETKQTVVNIEKNLEQLILHEKTARERWSSLKSNLPGYGAILLVVISWLASKGHLFI